MFRRRRNVNPYFSKQFFISGTLATEAASGGVAGTTFIDTVVLDADGLLGVQAAHASKKIVIAGITYQSDIFGSDTDGQVNETAWLPMGVAECWYQDSLSQPGAGPDTNSFLFENQVASATNVRTMPQRIVFRRYGFYSMTTGFDASGVGGTVETSGTAMSVPISWLVPGWHAPRHIKRKMSIKPTEGLLYRLELFNNTTLGVVNVVWQVAGVITYRIVT